METLEQRIRKTSVQYGLIFGAICLVLSIFSFYLITTMFSSMIAIVVGPLLFSILIPIVLVIVFCFDLRKKIGGYWTFKQATTGIFIMFFIAYLVQVIGRDVIFAKIIEPNMVQKTQEAAMNATTALMEKQGIDQTQIDEKKATIQKQFDDQKNITPGKIVQRTAITIIFLFVLALIFAAFYKKEPLLSNDEAAASYTEPEV